MKLNAYFANLLAMGLVSAAMAAEPVSPAGSPPPRGTPAVKSVRLILPAQSGLAVDGDTGLVDVYGMTVVDKSNDSAVVLKNIAGIFTRQVQQRCEGKVVTEGDAPLTVELAVAEGIGKEGFRIEDRQGGGVRIVGNDVRGVLYGVGKFLRTSRYDQGGFTPGNWRGTSVPQKPVRGIYLCTHFHNFYHDAPVEEVERYVEDLGLWGFNAVAFWYDMHHLDGFDDPEAKAVRQRLGAICATARRIGLDVGLTVIANEGYNNSPAKMRAQRAGGQRGGWYDCQICPSKPGGMEYLLQVIGQELDWIASYNPRYMWLWPYDQGGCGCANCRPWATNGFLTTAESLAALVRQKLPDAKIVLSTWFFDRADWHGLETEFAGKKPFFDYVMAEPVRGPIPGGLPLVGFPEISMYNTFPWGGFGATPLTGLVQGQWNRIKKVSSGGFPYSEGKFEDLTKVAISQFYFSDRPAAETVREYIAFEFSPEAVDDIAKVVATLEKNHHCRWWPGELEGVKLDLNWFPSKNAKPQADPGAEEAYAIVQRIDAKLTPQARCSWRWRQLYLRALLDSELKTNGGKPNDRCYEAFSELIRIYHAENANPAVRPPLPADYKPHNTTQR